MNDLNVSAYPPADASREEMMAARFASMVMQQTNLALLYLGEAPHPETGAPVLDLETARLFIDQLEMLEVKTKGNLGRREADLLKQNLTMLRLAFVEAVEHPAEPAAPPASTPEPAPPAADTPAAAAAESESRKKYSKKY